MLGMPRRRTHLSISDLGPTFFAYLFYFRWGHQLTKSIRISSRPLRANWIRMVAMTKKIRLFLLVVLGVISHTLAVALRIIEGPNFYNATDESVKLEVTFDSGQQWRANTPMVLKSHMLFADVEDHQVRTIAFTVGEKKYSLERAAVLKLRGDSRPRDQIWAFDGASICVVSAHRFDPEKGARCPP